MVELRTDPLFGRSVIIAAERSRRPQEFSGELTMAPESDPFREGNESETPGEVLADGLLRPSGVRHRITLIDK